MNYVPYIYCFHFHMIFLSSSPFILTYLYLFHTNLKGYAHQKEIFLFQQRETIFKIMDIKKGKQQRSSRRKWKRKNDEMIRLWLIRKQNRIDNILENNSRFYCHIGLAFWKQNDLLFFVFTCFIIQRCKKIIQHFVYLDHVAGDRCENWNSFFLFKWCIYFLTKSLL